MQRENNDVCVTMALGIIHTMRRIALAPQTTASSLQEAVDVLRAGGLVIYPTETTYGLAADAENPSAIEKLIRYKGKRDNKPLSVAVTDQQMAERYVILTDTAIDVYRRFLPGPVTVVSKSKGTVAPGVESPLATVGIRIPAHPVALELVRLYGRGITATGANASDKKRPYAVSDILDHTPEKSLQLIDLFLDAGTLPLNEPSTVIDTTQETLAVLRAGAQSFQSSEEYFSTSEEETIAFGRELARRFRSYYSYTPVFFLVDGDMGAGKTHLVKGIAAGLGISAPITSPTYLLAAEHSAISEGREYLFLHVDTWRMTSPEEIGTIGLDRAMSIPGVVAIEWAERVGEELPPLMNKAKVVRIYISVLDEQRRRLAITTD